MASPDERSIGRSAVLALVAAASSGALGYLGTGLHPVAALTWLVPLPVLLAAPRLRWPWALGATAAGWIAAQSTLWSYFAHQLRMPPGILVAVLAFYPLLAVAAVGLFRVLLRRGRPVAAALAVPAVWAAGEYLLSIAQPHGAWLSLAYTQAGLRPVVQVASLTGAWGVTFLVTGVPAVIAALAAPAVPRLRLAVAATVLLLLTAGYTTYRLAAAPPANRVRVAVLGGPVDGEPTPDSAAGRALLSRYTRQIAAAAAAGARVAVLPEKVFDTTPRTWPLVAGPLARLARRRHVDIVVGAVARRGGTATNVAVAFPADGAAPVSYSKRHLIPGLETDEVQPGHGPLRRVPGTRYGLIVCKDLDFPDLVRDNRNHGASVLLAPAWDLGGDGWLHSRMAVLRGVESGLWIARAGRYGRLTVSDPTGRVVAEADATARPDAVLVAAVATGATPTPYARVGDWFAWLCAAAAVALLAVALRGRRNAGPARRAGREPSGARLTGSAGPGTPAAPVARDCPGPSW
ncbi:hypothetical protein Athai_67400 [Actinocatenispora thailandica]|uniref:CN hydrolase domain-containing protein n=1 Tax=Actinocatenispora thailandica TaxID=227318 RepID=A0A7R7DWL9_9ACTN|nr:nitrilase-related carbon-nitrogen hydrolase [Actinocatenispora thailandica]BCJ39237.1 hypothetical protein Athai_67400 [Actinocatenispora thailandica]